MIKRAIQAVKVVGVNFNRKDVLVVLEKGKNAQRLIKVIEVALDGKFPWETAILETFSKEVDKPSAFICSECRRQFKTERGLKSHFSRKHRYKELPEALEAVTKKTSPEEKMAAFKRWLDENPKKVLVLQREDDSIFIEGQRDVRPLKYIDESDGL